MLEVTRTTRVLLLLQQFCFASCAVAGYPVNNNPLSARINRLPATNSIINFNGTAAGNLTEGPYSVHDHSAYCNNGNDWYHPDAQAFNAAGCEDAIKDLVDVDWNIDHRLYWSFPGRNDDDHQETPLTHTSGDCVLTIWPRYLFAGDGPFRDAEPAGTQHYDMASLHDIATLAYRVFEQCMVQAPHPSAGWVPAGDFNSLFVGFWEEGSNLDLWLDGQQATLPPAVAVT